MTSEIRPVNVHLEKFAIVYIFFSCQIVFTLDHIEVILIESCFRILPSADFAFSQFRVLPRPHHGRQTLPYQGPKRESSPSSRNRLRLRMNFIIAQSFNIITKRKKLANDKNGDLTLPGFSCKKKF